MKQKDGVRYHHNSTIRVKPDAKRIERTQLAKSQKPIPKVNKKRQAREMPRKFGTPTRRRWVKAQDCSACGVEGWSVNAHVGREGAGASRKANHDQIAPLCRSRRAYSPEYGCVMETEGCHELSHRDPAKFAARFPWWNAEEQCAATQRKWERYVEMGGDGSDLEQWEESA
jgi:hypothetical protein